MNWWRDFMEQTARHGNETSVGEILTACDAVLQREDDATEVAYLVCLSQFCNRRLAEIADERETWQRSG